MGIEDVLLVTNIGYKGETQRFVNKNVLLSILYSTLQLPLAGWIKLTWHGDNFDH